MIGRPGATRRRGRRRREISRLSGAIAAVAMSFCGAKAFASTIQEIEMTCPYDGTRFSYTAQMSATAFDTALDFMPVGAIIAPWPLAVCPTNGFVFFKEAFDAEELERLRPLILSPEYQALKGETAYYRAAWIVERTGGSHGDVSALLLKATWEASRDAGRYQRYAAELIDRLPDDIRASSAEQKAESQQLLGELMRRIGKFTEAKQHFMERERELDPKSTEGLVAAFEIQLIDKRDAQPHFYSEVLKSAESKPEIWLARRTPSLSDGSRLAQVNVFKLNHIFGVRWLANDRLFATSRSTVMLFDVTSGATTSIETPVSWSNPPISAQEGSLVVAQGIDPLHGQILFQADARSFTLHNWAPATGWASSIVMAHDGRSALTELDNRLFAFDLGGDALRPLPSPTALAGDERWWLSAADPTGPRVALYHEDEILVWDYDKGALLRRLRPPGWIKSMNAEVVYSRDGKRLFIAADAYWDRECELTVWDSQSGSLRSRRRVKGAPGAQLAVSLDERVIAVLCGNWLYLWDSRLSDPPFETVQAKYDSRFLGVSFSPDSRNLSVELDDALVVFSINP